MTEDNWKQTINIAERILIKTHPPALNKQENAGLFTSEGFKGKHYLILNWGAYGSLLPEASTFSASYFSWNYNTLISKEDLKK